MGYPLAELVKYVDFVSQLLTLTEGDPLLVSLYVEDLLSREDSVARLIPEDLKNISPGNGPESMVWYTWLLVW